MTPTSGDPRAHTLAESATSRPRNTGGTTALDLSAHHPVTPPTKRRHENRDGSNFSKSVDRRTSPALVALLTWIIGMITRLIQPVRGSNLIAGELGVVFVQKHTGGPEVIKLDSNHAV